jgi:hypothetical protein
MWGRRFRLPCVPEQAIISQSRQRVGSGKAVSRDERLNILIELRDRHHPDAAEQRLARVYRVVELERS